MTVGDMPFALSDDLDFTAHSQSGKLNPGQPQDVKVAWVETLQRHSLLNYVHNTVVLEGMQITVMYDPGTKVEVLTGVDTVTTQVDLVLNIAIRRVILPGESVVISIEAN